LWYVVGNKILTLTANVLFNTCIGDLEDGSQAAARTALDRPVSRALPGTPLPPISKESSLAHSVLTDMPLSVDDDLQTEVLETLGDAWRYRRWLADLARPHLGLNPVEIGSGTGDYAAEWLPDVATMTVTECEEGRLLALKDRFAGYAGVEVASLSLPATVINGGHSAAVALNVLEHIGDDVGAVRSMAQLVRPGGRVVVLVPAFEFAMSRFDRSVGHVRRYTRRQLRGVFEAAGLTCVRTRYVNAVGLLSWLLLVRGLRLTPRNGSLVRLFDRCLVPPQRLLERWVRPPFGQSVLAVALVPGEAARV
jgi:SAM-dependent methyltransferase